MPAADWNNDGGLPEEEGEAPVFVDMDSAVEVDVPGGGGDMDDDDGDAAMDAAVQDGKEAASSSSQPRPPPTPDRSTAAFSSHADAVYAVASRYDASSRTLLVASGGGDDRAFLHRVRAVEGGEGTGRPTTETIPLSHRHTDSVSCLAFNSAYVDSDVSGKPQRELLAAGCYDGSIALYDPSDGAFVRALEGPTDVEFVTFHPKGGTVLLAGSAADGTLWMYHVPTHNCLQVFVGHEGGVVAGGFTPDGRWAVSAGRDGTVRVWAPKTGRSKHVFRLMDDRPRGEEGPGLTCLALGGGADGQLAVCGGEDGRAHVVHVSGKKVAATLHHFDESTDGDRKDVSNAGSSEDAMDEDDEEEGEPRSVRGRGVLPDLGPGDRRMWNVASGAAQLRRRCAREDAKEGGGEGAPRAGITRLTWHASRPLVICAYADGFVGVWDARTGTLAEALTGCRDVINDLSASFVEEGGGGGGGGALVVAGGDDRTVKVFESRA
ncbi:hypothetical protein ACHAWF_002815 [Thalassiosira exigua]